MSTGANCTFEEREPNRWWYVLQCYPYGETEDYEEYGPFSSEDAAHDHLHNNHANPGGYSVINHTEYAKASDRKEYRSSTRKSTKKESFYAPAKKRRMW